MNERIAKLESADARGQAVDQRERAALITEFYKRPERAPCRRRCSHALAFKYLMENKTIFINDGELIVGERGPAPKATPTYPELCCHSLAGPATSSTTARRTPSLPVDARRGRVYARRSSPSGRARSMRDRIFAEMTQEWIDAYEAGMFTEFMEQRAPGHTVLDDKIYRKGMLDFKQDIQKQPGRPRLPERSRRPTTSRKSSRPWSICADAMIRFAGVTRRRPGSWPRPRTDPHRKAELRADRRGLLARPGPRPARLLGSPAILLVRPPRRHHRDTTLGLLQPRPARSAPVSLLQEGAGRRDADARSRPRNCSSASGSSSTTSRPRRRSASRPRRAGPTPTSPRSTSAACKEDGSDGVNEVTYLILDVIEEMRLLQPSSIGPGQQEEPGPVPQAGRSDHPHRVRPALGLQHRRHRPGAGPHGQVRRRRPQRRLQRLRRGRARSARKPTS